LVKLFKYKFLSPVNRTSRKYTKKIVVTVQENFPRPKLLLQFFFRSQVFRDIFFCMYVIIFFYYTLFLIFFLFSHLFESRHDYTPLRIRFFSVGHPSSQTGSRFGEYIYIFICTQTIYCIASLKTIVYILYTYISCKNI